VRPARRVNPNWRKIMEKAIESDIRINDVVSQVVVDEVIVNHEVPVEDVEVPVSESVVADGVMDPHVVVVNVDQV
jgi:hypothetical protein